MKIWTVRVLWMTALSLILVAGAAAPRASADYPLTLVLDARAKTETASATVMLTIQVDRLMEESRRKRVSDALLHGGYPGFLPALRALPAIGTIGFETRSVEIEYAVESGSGADRRLVLVADRPLFFLNTDKSRNKAGYELTMVELRFDARGAASGTLMGAARVKPLGDGDIGIDDFADVEVSLGPHATSK